jgi:EpsI family protein
LLIRAIVAALLLTGAGLVAKEATGSERVPERTPLAGLPASVGEWEGRDAAPLADDVVVQLGVDDYINRRYISASGTQVALYAGYYASQRQGDTIHSPQNCLPGAGWRPVFADRVTIDADGRRLPVNRVVIQKGLDRQAVFYWYQGRGRLVANEFANKGWLMLDAARLRRTDGGLVRLITPVSSTPDAAFATLTAFSATLVPRLIPHLP